MEEITLHTIEEAQQQGNVDELARLAKEILDRNVSLQQARPKPNEKPPTKQDYKDALIVQDACNLSGVVFSFNNVMKRICNEAHQEGHGTDWKNSHPIAKLYIDKMNSLTHGITFNEAYDKCEERAK